jgi:hypothetical protein
MQRKEKREDTRHPVEDYPMKNLFALLLSLAASTVACKADNTSSASAVKDAPLANRLCGDVYSALAVTLCIHGDNSAVWVNHNVPGGLMENYDVISVQPSTTLLGATAYLATGDLSEIGLSTEQTFALVIQEQTLRGEFLYQTASGIWTQFPGGFFTMYDPGHFFPSAPPAS